MWFLRKDPGLRLRIRDLDLDLVRPALARLQDAGMISAWFPGIYEPEVHQFGGPEAMHAVHAYFDADTAALVRLATSSNRRLASTVLTLAVLNDLFERAVLVHEEVWDVWCNLQAMYRGHGRPRPEVPALGLAGLRRLAGPDEHAIIELYAVANRELAAAFDRLWRRGALTCGRRAILPYVAAFLWNRHGVDIERMATLSDTMAAAWNPKRNLRGAAIEACTA